jgi:hypothetical protein
MDAPLPRRRLWPYVVALTGAAMIAGATAGAASSDDDSAAASPAPPTQTELVRDQQHGTDCPAEGGGRRQPRQTALDPV